MNIFGKGVPIIFHSLDMDKNIYIYRFADKAKHCVANTVTGVKSFGQPYGSIICEKHFFFFFIQTNQFQINLCTN